MNKRFIIKITLLLLFFTNFAYAVTGDEALAKFRGRMYGISQLTGIISWANATGMTYTGTFKYLNPGKIYVKFSSPAGKVIVSNGKKLWVYSPSSNICGIQDLGRGGSGGISSFTKGYFAIVTSQGPSGYTIKLKNSDKTYSEIILMVDSTYFLKKAIFKTKNGNAYNFSISNTSTSARVMPTLFSFDVPASAQVVKNPLNIR